MLSSFANSAKKQLHIRGYVEKYVTCSGCDEHHLKSPKGTSFRFIGVYFQ